MAKPPGMVVGVLVESSKLDYSECLDIIVDFIMGCVLTLLYLCPSYALPPSCSGPIVPHSQVLFLQDLRHHHDSSKRNNN